MAIWVALDVLPPVQKRMSSMMFGSMDRIGTATSRSLVPSMAESMVPEMITTALPLASAAVTAAGVVTTVLSPRAVRRPRKVVSMAIRVVEAATKRATVGGGGRSGA